MKVSEPLLMSSLRIKSICPKQQNIGTVLWATVCQLTMYQKVHYPWQQLRYVNYLLLIRLTKHCIRLNTCSRCSQLEALSSRWSQTAAPLKVSWQPGLRGLPFICLISKLYCQKPGRKLWWPLWKLLRRRKEHFWSLSKWPKHLTIVRLLMLTKVTKYFIDTSNWLDSLSRFFSVMILNTSQL